MADKILIPAAALETFAAVALHTAGMRQQHAALVARTLIYADMRGIGSHGVTRLSAYLDRVAAEVMEIDPEMHVSRDAPGAALLDAANGFGQLAGIRAMDLAIDKAAAVGTGAVGVARSNHFGVAGFFVERAARAGMIGMVLTNASPAMAPWNTRSPLLGTNPIAFGIPAAEEQPIVLDMSTSVVARGKIRLASMTGGTIPRGWAVDAEGRPTEDPQAALKGTLAPVGGAKGAGLSLVIDILTGVLTGTALTGQVRNITDTAGPSSTGHLFVAIDPGRLTEASEFRTRVDAVIRMIRALPPADGGVVFLPGEIEAREADRRAKAGVPLPVDILKTLDALARTLNIETLASSTAAVSG
jgi:LDH2 family malate/lactate/ureidoglycolate dehydrogenase